MAEHGGHSSPEAAHHAAPSGGGKGGKGFVRNLAEGLGEEILGGVVQTSLDAVQGIGEIVDQAARLGHSKSGGGGGKSH